MKTLALCLPASGQSHAMKCRESPRSFQRDTEKGQRFCATEKSTAKRH